ncbi:hypothetical protein DFJ74DRAFT_652005 [Hyaloraphidium curvatum]|nr:hypothetical protein DFJ74DRAFT_652005 [Hyaloraphidium curvatum]
MARPPQAMPPGPPLGSGELTALTSVGNQHSLAALDPAAGRRPLLDVELPPTTGIYSASGFDLMAVLARVVTRPNPKIDLGPVDFSCAFVVSDVKKPDNPVVYCSTNFTKLTGYTLPEILGRNCRFLQAPNGDVKAGEVRKYTDNAIIYELKQKLDNFEECQFILINYKKSGEPFINLVTCIPVQWGEKPNDYAFMVGFQIDLVDQPQNILARLRDGTYTVNYQALWKRDDDQSSSADGPLSITNEVEDLLSPSNSQFSPTPSFESFTSSLNDTGLIGKNGSGKDVDGELAFYRAIVEHGKDFVHILSLRGRFLYVSRRASAKLLEFSEEELVGRGLSEFCHPADLLVVMRDLRSAVPGDSIQLLYRFKRKRSGYIWLEARGHVYEGESKRTKCFVLSGREKLVGSANTKDISHNLDVRDPRVDFWAKLSLNGLFLFATPSCVSILGTDANSVVGASFLDFVPKEYREAIRQTLLDYGQPAPPNKATRSGTIQLTLSTPHGHLPVSMWVYRTPPGVANGMKPVGPPFVLVQVMSGHVGPGDELPNGFANGVAKDVYGIMDPTRASSFPYEREKLRALNKKLQDELASVAPSRKRANPA